jgi:hypothetical protein
LIVSSLAQVLPIDLSCAAHPLHSPAPTPKVLDLARKLFLTTFVLFIDTASGTTRILRLVIAGVVSGTYLALLSMARPYKRFDDLQIAAFANLLLTLIFALSIIIKVCEDGLCSELIGLPDSYGATLLVVLLTIALLIVSVATIAFQAATTARAQRIKLKPTRRAPVLDLPPDRHFHCLLSHVWGSGQDATHTVTHKLQLLLPSVRVWLDIYNLTRIDKLDDEVAKAVVFIIFASKGYFKSTNCRKELYAALKQQKQIVVVHDPEKGEASLDELRRECREWCVDVAPPEHENYRGPDKAVAAVFECNEPVMWSRAHEFQQISLKIIVTRLLRHMPHYSSHAAELGAGVFVTKEIGPHAFSRPVRILTCASTTGAHGVAKELAEAASHPGWAHVQVTEVLPDFSLEELTSKAAPQRASDVLLIHLNTDTFVGDNGEETADILRKLLSACPGIPFVLVKEEDPTNGGCPFSTFIQTAPRDLQVEPYKLFRPIAVSLFPAPEYRCVSFRLLLRNMGATPLHSRRAAQLTRWWRLGGSFFVRKAHNSAIKVDGQSQQVPGLSV